MSALASIYICEDMDERTGATTRKGSDQIAHKRRLILGFAGRTYDKSHAAAQLYVKYHPKSCYIIFISRPFVVDPLYNT